MSGQHARRQADSSQARMVKWALRVVHGGGIMPPSRARAESKLGRGMAHMRVRANLARDE
jgi:hypothetical protein